MPALQSPATDSPVLYSKIAFSVPALQSPATVSSVLYSKCTATQFSARKTDDNKWPRNRDFCGRM
jgi:hypothetical protein